MRMQTTLGRRRSKRGISRRLVVKNVWKERPRFVLINSHFVTLSVWVFMKYHVLIVEVLPTSAPLYIPWFCAMRFVERDLFHYLSLCDKLYLPLLLPLDLALICV